MSVCAVVGFLAEATHVARVTRRTRRRDRKQDGVVIAVETRGMDALHVAAAAALVRDEMSRSGGLVSREVGWLAAACAERRP